MSQIVESIMEFLWKFIIMLVAGIYNVIGYIYEIFLLLAKTNIFSQENYSELVEKIYVLLGVIMLFVLAYNLLTFVVDPDKNKEGKSVEKILKNLVFSLIMIILCPSIFTFAFQVQGALLASDSPLYGLFSSQVGSPEDAQSTINAGGRLMASTTFSAFFTGESDAVTNASDSGSSTCSSKGSCTLADAKNAAREEGNFVSYRGFALNIHQGTVEFNWLLSLVAGIYLLYVLVSFCLDLAVRVVKLAFYQIVAPMTIACRIIPSKEGVFKNWLSAVTKTFCSVFIRVFIMTFVIYLMSLFDFENFFKFQCSDGTCSTGVVPLANALIILGLITFIKQAIKMIDDLFGLGGDINLGIKDKLKGGGAFALGAAAGAGTTSAVRNLTHAVSNVRGAKGFAGKSAAVLRGVGSTVTGGVMGAGRGFIYGNSAGDFKSMFSSANKATTVTTDNRDNREAYRASHDLGPIKGTTPYIGGIATVAGHASDAVSSVRSWAGIGNVDGLIAENKQVDLVSGAVDAVKDTARDVLISDAGKGKDNRYGISKTKKYEHKDSSGTVKSSFEFSSGVYHKMDQAVRDARSAGQTTLTFNGTTYDVSEMEDLMGKYAKDMSELMANEAARTNDNWKYFTQTAVNDATEQATHGYTGNEDLQLSKVRDKAVELRGVLQQNINSEVVANTNNNGAVISNPANQRITAQTLRDEDLVFTGDSALGKLSDEGKRIKSRNNAEIFARKQKENNDKK